MTELIEITSKFNTLKSTPMDSTVLFHETISLMHLLCGALLRAEAGTTNRHQILPLIRDIRAIHSLSPFVKRLQEWPNGYPGDYVTVEYLCDATNQAPTDSIGFFIEQYALHSAITEQHRNKISYQSRAIAETCRRFSNPNILSIGCGGCRDLRSIANHWNLKNAIFSLNDMDISAINYAARKLNEFGLRCVYLKDNIVRCIRSLRDKGLSFELCVAGGLFDYINNQRLTALLHRIYTLIRTGGSFIFANIAKDNPFRPWMEYVANWFLIERSEDELIDLCTRAGIPASAIHLTRDSTNLSIIVTIDKE